MEYNPDFNFEGDRIATSRPVITRRYGSAANQDGADLFVSFGRLLILLVLASPLIIAVGYSLSHPRSESGKSVTEMLDEWERKKEHERMLEAWEPGYHKHQQEYQELAEAAEKASQQGDRAEAERLKAQLNEMQNKRFYLRR